MEAITPLPAFISHSIIAIDTPLLAIIIDAELSLNTPIFRHSRRHVSCRGWPADDIGHYYFHY